MEDEPMRWNKYTIETTTAAEDYMSSMLLELGIDLAVLNIAVLPASFSFLGL